MTTLQTYENVCAMLYDFDTRTGNRGAENVIKDPYTWIKQNAFEFYRVAAEMIIDCRASLDKKVSSGARLSALKRLLKSAEKQLNNNIHGMFEQGGKFCLLDGIRAVRLNSDYESIKHLDNDAPRVNLDGIMKEAINGNAEQVETPAVSAVKEYIAKAKAKTGKAKDNGIVYKIGPAYVNPQYLLDMLETLPDCQIFVKDAKKPLYFCTVDGEDGILCPVRSDEKHVL